MVEPSRRRSLPSIKASRDTSAGRSGPMAPCRGEDQSVDRVARTPDPVATRILRDQSCGHALARPRFVPRGDVSVEAADVVEETRVLGAGAEAFAGCAPGWAQLVRHGIVQHDGHPVAGSTDAALPFGVGDVALEQPGWIHEREQRGRPGSSSRSP